MFKLKRALVTLNLIPCNHFHDDDDDHYHHHHLFCHHHNHHHLCVIISTFIIVFVIINAILRVAQNSYFAKRSIIAEYTFSEPSTAEQNWWKQDNTIDRIAFPRKLSVNFATQSKLFEAFVYNYIPNMYKLAQNWISYNTKKILDDYKFNIFLSA